MLPMSSPRDGPLGRRLRAAGDVVRRTGRTGRVLRLRPVAAGALLGAALLAAGADATAQRIYVGFEEGGPRARTANSTQTFLNHPTRCDALLYPEGLTPPERSLPAAPARGSHGDHELLRRRYRVRLWLDGRPRLRRPARRAGFPDAGPRTGHPAHQGCRRQRGPEREEGRMGDGPVGDALRCPGRRGLPEPLLRLREPHALDAVRGGRVRTGADRGPLRRELRPQTGAGVPGRSSSFPTGRRKRNAPPPGPPTC